MHATGDGEVPIEQARILQRQVDAAGKGSLIVQRVLRDPTHCGFTSTEWEASLEELVAWVEHGVKPPGSNVLVEDLRTARTFELNPRPGTPEADAVLGTHDRVVVHGHLTLNGAPFDATFLGAIVGRNGLITPCQYALTSVNNGQYEITVLADRESSGCGAPGAEVWLWTSAHNQLLYTKEAASWPGNGGTTIFNASFSDSSPNDGVPPMVEFSGEVFRRDGRQLPAGTLIEAYVGRTRCGMASVRRTGDFSGYILAVIGPESVPGYDRGATITFRIDGQAAADTTVNDRHGGGSVDLTLR